MSVHLGHLFAMVLLLRVSGLFLPFTNTTLLYLTCHVSCWCAGGVCVDVIHITGLEAC